MRIGIAVDHGGFELKESLLARLRVSGYNVRDFGADFVNSSDDYPEFVIPLAESIADGRLERGIGLCGSGLGASACANKLPGVRASLMPDTFSARHGVADDHINVICPGGRTVGPA